MSNTGDRFIWCEYDSENNVIGTRHEITSTTAFTTSATAKYIRFCTNITETPANVMIEEGSTATDYESYTNGPSPNPNYPQPIHVVTGSNTIGVQGRNLFDENILKQETNYNTYDSTTQLWTTNSGGSYGRSILYNATSYSSRNINKLVPLTSAGTYTLKLYDFVNNTSYASALELVLFDNEGSKISQTTQSSNFIKFTIDSPCYMDLCRRNNSGTISFSKVILVKGDYTEQTLPDYISYYHADYPVNLGSFELCKIGDYQDYLYKENGNWYKKNILNKYIFSGNENIKKATNVFYTDDIANNILTSGIICLCNRMKAVNNTPTGSSVPVNSCCFRPGDYSRFYFNLSSITTDVNEIKQYLSNNNTYVIYPLAVPTSTQITDETLISQLNTIEKAKSSEDQTNISQTNADLPFIINATALLKND